MEGVAFLEVRAGGGRGDGGDVGIVGVPLVDVVQQAPDLGGGDAGGDLFVGGEVVGCAGLVAEGPDDGGLGRVVLWVVDGLVVDLHGYGRCDRMLDRVFAGGDGRWYT